MSNSIIKRDVEIQLIYSQITDIDTVKGKYTAEIYIESKWQDQSIKDCVKQYNANQHWNPEIRVLNLINGYSEETFYKIYYDSQSLSTIVYEIKKINGDFWQPLELQYFPFDIQSMTVLISTRKTINEVNLIECKSAPSKVYNNYVDNEMLDEWDFFRRLKSTHAAKKIILKNANLGVIDNNVWILHKHVKINNFVYSEKFLSHSLHSEDIDHSALNIRCRCSRRPGYFIYNFILLVFLITLASIFVFSIDPLVSPNRFMATCTLLLTSITFRWVLNNVLPNVRYLTSLDLYALLSLIFIAISLVWHSIFESHYFFKDEIYARHVDHVFFLVYIGLVAIKHAYFMIWLVGVYRRRNEMFMHDKEYDEACKKYENQEKQIDQFQDINLLLS